MITILIIALTAVISFSAFNNYGLMERLKFSPYIIHHDRKQWYRFITVGLVHADFTHLLVNMLTLYFFGSVLEKIFSPIQYVLFYITALMFSGVPSFEKHKNHSYYNAVGASGAVSAILFSLVLYAPWSTIYLHFFIPIYFILYAVAYLIYSYYMGKRGYDNIGHDAHLYGAIYGIIFTLVTHPESFRIFISQIAHPPFL